MLDLVLLFYTWLGAQIAVLPFEVPILILILVLRLEVAQLKAIREVIPDMSAEERRIMRVVGRAYITEEVARFRRRCLTCNLCGETSHSVSDHTFIPMAVMP